MKYALKVTVIEAKKSQELTVALLMMNCFLLEVFFLKLNYLESLWKVLLSILEINLFIIQILELLYLMGPYIC